MAVPVWSHSRLSTYETCPRQYKFQYLDRLDIADVETVEQFLGLRVHETVETGGSRSDGAWIGAAAGAGIGLIVGLVAGIKKGAERHRQYRETYDRCLAGRGAI